MYLTYIGTEWCDTIVYDVEGWLSLAIELLNQKWFLTLVIPPLSLSTMYKSVTIRCASHLNHIKELTNVIRQGLQIFPLYVATQTAML